MTRSGHLPRIDALRGVAVIAVLLFHAYPAAFPLGYLGVDVFFVVSGFVIARTYLDALARRETSWGRFWIKRVRRLVPAYLVCILSTAALSVFVLEPHLLVGFGKSLLLQPLYLQNVLFWVEGDYFDHALTKPLLHTWSLAIEEQFYLFFFVPVLLVRFVRSRTSVLLVVLAAACLSFAASALVGGISPKTAFYLLPFRAWQFLAGIAAFIVGGALIRAVRRPSAALDGIALGGLFVLALLVLRPSDVDRASDGYALGVTALTAISLALYEVSAGRSPLEPLLGPLNHVGRLSYSLYLWHWPLISLAAMHLGRALDATEASLCLALSLALAALSWRYVETPLRGLPRDGRAFPSVLGGALGYGIVVATGSALLLTHGALFRYPEPERTWLRVSQDRSPYRCPYLTRVLDPASELCRVGTGGDAPGLLIVGDSHADQLDEAIGALGEESGVPVYLATRNCDLDEFLRTDYCDEGVLSSLLDQAEALGIAHVLAISAWVDGRSMNGFERAVAAFVARGIDITVVPTVPVDPHFNPRHRAELSLAGAAAPTYDAGRLALQNAALERTLDELIERYPDSVSVLDTGAAVCPDAGACEWLDGDRPLYFDDGHLSVHGVSRVEPFYRELMERLSRRPSMPPADGGSPGEPPTP